jgi:outer membrane protein TolC
LSHARPPITEGGRGAARAGAVSALEMTDDQLEAVHREIANGTTFTVFNLIRNMALEAAALAAEETDVVEHTGDTYYAQLGDGRATIRAVAQAIRALKGKS